MHGIDTAHGGGVLLLKLTENLSGRKVKALLAGLYCTKIVVEDIFGEINTIERRILGLQHLLLFLGEPATPTRKQFRLQLRIDLVMLYVLAVYHPLHFHAKETTASRRVGKQVETVARTDERGDTGQLAEITLAGFTDIQVGHLHQVFQQRHLALGILIELVHVQQQMAGIQNDVRFIGMDDTIEIWAKEKAEQPFMEAEEFGEALQEILGDEDYWEDEEE